MHVLLWIFEVPSEQRSEFERVYGPEGDWVRLFSRSPEYVGTQLLPDPERAGHYVTVDSWISREAFDAFKEQWKAEYDALDRACEKLTTTELSLGTFDA